jgi:hypothetical protein
VIASERNETTRAPDRGFALPVAVLGLVIVGVLVTGGFYVARQEARIGSASEHGTQAFYMAEQGVADVIVNWDMQTYGMDSLWNTRTVTDTTPSGIWSVDVTRMTDRLFFLDATGSAPLSAILAGGGVADEHAATRRVGMIARVVSASIDPPAALTTRGDVEIQGTAEVHGEDTDPGGWGAVCSGIDGEDKPGILVDDNSNVSHSGVGEVTGDPAVAYDASIGDATFKQFGDLTWADLTALANWTFSGGTFNGMGPSFTETGECDTDDPMNWGDPFNPGSACGSYFPIIHVRGELLSQSGGVGQGLLLVDGDVDLRGGFTWHGVVISQGNFETQGNGNRVLGGVMASNASLDDERLVGGSIVQNSTCAVTRAILLNRALTRPRPLGQRSWVDLSSVMP